MNRTTNLFLFACLVAMLAVAAGVVAVRWETFGHLAELSGRARNLPMAGLAGILLCPAWLVTGALIMRRQMARPGLRMADDRRRYNELTLMAGAVLVLLMQLWMASGFLATKLPGALGVRVLEALSGVFLIVAANFSAKTSPPTGERAPDPGVWTRSLLRISWISVGAGFVIVLAAILADLHALPWIVMTASLTAVGSALLHKRALRQGRV